MSKAKIDLTPSAALCSVLSTQYSVLRLSILFPVLFLIVGCGREVGPRCYPVKGQVFYQDQPVAEAMVVFHPTAPPAENFPRPIAHTDATGRFELTTLRAGDGAPAGEYTITVELREQRQVGEELVRDGPNLLPPLFAKPQSTPLRHKVDSGANDLPAFKL